MLYSHKKILRLDPSVVEEICLSVSQEFYDNATSGNYHFGDMKLAYDWWVTLDRAIHIIYITAI